MPPAFLQQTSGGGYPGQQPPRGKSFMIPLIALASTLVVLVMAIVIVVAVRGGDEDPLVGPTTAPTTGGGTRPTVSATPASDLDECVIGTWRVTSHREEVPVNGTRVTFIGGEGATLRLNPDGTGKTDYRSGTEFQGTASGRTYKLEVSGALTFRYTARGGTTRFTEVDSDASGKLFIDGEQYGGTIPFNAESDSSTYTCSATLLTQKTFLYTTEYEKVS